MGLFRKCNPAFLFGLRAGGWNDPEMGIEVHLRPRGPNDLVRLRGIEDRKFERVSGESFLCMRVDRERGDVLVWRAG